ncbi:MAG: hypothetical protein EOO27_39315 [Comamonadaceae bacterium]|nr:MAG: hypothetical protein EOO27_39315 [Comamonadaceae bacterium]
MAITEPKPARTFPDSAEAEARAALAALWDTLGAGGDPAHRCSLAHYLAELHDDAEQSLIGALRAREAAESLPDVVADRYRPVLLAGVADAYRRLGSSAVAAQILDEASVTNDRLSPGDQIDARTEIIRIRAALEHQSTMRLRPQ